MNKVNASFRVSLPRACVLLLSICILLAHLQFVSNQPAYGYGPDTIYDFHPASHEIYAIDARVHNPAYAYDRFNDTYTEINYGQGPEGYYQLVTFGTVMAHAPITQVDFEMKYSADANILGEKYEIEYYVNTTVGTMVLQSETSEAHPLGLRKWTNVPEPIDGTWNWTDISNIKFRVSISQAKGGTMDSYFHEYEAWVTVHFTAPENPNISISPSNVTDYDLTPNTTVTLRPDGDGTYHGWTGTPTDTFDDWNDVTPDGDTSYFYTNFPWMYQSSTLEDVSGTETWSIAGVRVVIIAKGTSGSIVDLILVIGGTTYHGVTHTLTEEYSTYASDCGINSVTDDYWTWSDINAVEAGVCARVGEIWVTQLYVEVIGCRLAVDLSVDYVENLWGFQFELTFDPNVIQGILVERSIPFSIGPFLESAPGSKIFLEGAGWNIHVGKLGLTACHIRMPPPYPAPHSWFCPTGGGVLATIIFSVVGLGETEIRLGENSALMNYLGEWVTYGREYVEDGHFRNIDSALMPTAAFIFEPVDTPLEQGPLEGHNITFTSISTPAPDRTLTTYKWYFWTTYRDKLESSIVTDVITVTCNYTRRGTWNVTLTVIDDQGVVATTTSYVDVKAHDVAITSIKTNTTGGLYLEGIPHTDIGDILEINVTLENQGDFTEDFNVSCFWSAYYEGKFHYGSINQSIETPTHVENLLPGEIRILTFYWDTTGRNLTHLIYHIIHANASRVPYEYDTERRIGKIIENEFIDHFHRITFHDIAITRVETNATAVYAGEIVEFRVTVVNQGDYNITNIMVSIYYDENIVGTEIIPLMTTKTFALMKLWKNYTTTLTFIWNTTGILWANYTIRVEATWAGWATEDYEPHDNVLMEYFYVKIPGDVDGNGIVDGFDLTHMCSTYGSTPGAPKWDEECDINLDGIIDGFDLTQACGNYGKHL